MLAPTTIANEFPLLAAIARELGGADDGNEMLVRRNARRVLKDAFQSFDRAADVAGAARFTHCRAAGAGHNKGW